MISLVTLMCLVCIVDKVCPKPRGALEKSDLCTRTNSQYWSDILSDCGEGQRRERERERERQRDRERERERERPVSVTELLFLLFRMTYLSVSVRKGKLVAFDAVCFKFDNFHFCVGSLLFTKQHIVSLFW